MRHRIISINISGKTEGDLEVSFNEAVSKITNGYTSGQDRNETANYRFNVENSVSDIEIGEISARATEIATSLTSLRVKPSELILFARCPTGLNCDDFSGYIQGNAASIVQVMIDERGGLEQDGDTDVVEAANRYFGLRLE